MNHYIFNIREYALATRHLTNEEDLCLRRLIGLSVIKDRDESIEMTASVISRLIKVPEELVIRIREEFFIRDEWGWHCPAAFITKNKLKKELK